MAISCPAIKAVRERAGCQLSDQQLAEIAALFLRRTLEQGYDPSQTELLVGDNELRPLAQELGFLKSDKSESWQGVSRERKKASAA